MLSPVAFILAFDIQLQYQDPKLRSLINTRPVSKWSLVGALILANRRDRIHSLYHVAWDPLYIKNRQMAIVLSLACLLVLFLTSRRLRWLPHRPKHVPGGTARC